MKKKIIILLLAGFPIITLGQGRATKTNGPCTAEMAYNHKGRWVNSGDLFFDNKLGSQSEMIKRLDEIHKMVLALYPEPLGYDLAWHRVIRNNTFGGKVTSDKTRDGVIRHYRTLQGIPVADNYYTVGIYNYLCNYDTKNEIVGGFPGATSAGLDIRINCLDNFIGTDAGSCMRINGIPVGMRLPVQGTWKGYEIAYNPLSSSTRSILIHRQGMLPYIPVTRKQYLDHSIEHLTEIMNDAIKLQMDMPLRSLKEQEDEKKKKLEKFEKDFGKDPKRLKSAVDYYLAGYKTEQDERDERVKKLTKTSETLVKEYRDELENSRKSGMLDSAATVLDWHPAQTGGQIFFTEKQGGKMLVIDNPAYLRKDLPKYVPQFMTLHWSTHDDHPPEAKFGEVIKTKFPVEKLAAMIDR
jgi:hypothetical protein